MGHQPGAEEPAGEASGLEDSATLLPRWKAAFGLLDAGMCSCGSNTEAKELRLVGRNAPERLELVLRDVHSRPTLHPESRALIAMFLDVTTGTAEFFDFRERCYRACGVR